MKALRSLFLLAVILVSFRSYGQHPLFIDPNALRFIPDSVHIGDSAIFNIAIYNADTVSFSDSLAFNYSINGILHTSSNSSSGFSFSVGRDSLGFADSVVKTVVVHFTGPQFVAGPTVVVIWPVAPHSRTIDSASKILPVLLPAGIEEANREKLKVFLFNKQITILCQGENSFGHVRIYDITGAVIHEQNFSQTAGIPTSPFASGIYLVEITLADNTRFVYKLVNTN